MKPRQYQNDAINAVFSQWDSGIVATLIEMATGLGKTITFGHICAFVPGRSLILAHREELLTQAVEKMNSIDPEGGVELERQADRATACWSGGRGGKYVVGSKDTMWRPDRLERFSPNEFEVVVVDEAHHGVRKSATYWRILKRFVKPPIGEGTASLLGVTALGERDDKEALGGIYQSVAYRYPIWQGIEDGYLVPIETFKVEMEELSVYCERMTGGDGDFTQSELERIGEQEWYVHQVLKPLVDVANQGGQRSALIFMPSVRAAQKATDMLNLRYATNAKAVSILSEDPDERKANLAGFQDGRYQYIVNCDCLVEGWDSDRVQVVALKPTGSRQKLVQMVGRGTRPWGACVDIWPDREGRLLSIAATPKPKLTVLDPVGVTLQHKLRGTVDIFRGVYSPEVLEVARKLNRDGIPRPDLAIKKAMEQLRFQEEERRKGILARCSYKLSPVDLFDYFKVRRVRCPRRLLNKPATDKMVAFLEGRGVRTRGDLGFWDAKTLIDRIKTEEANAPASIPQRKLLHRYGLNPEVTKGEAQATIERLRKSGWKRERVLV